VPRRNRPKHPRGFIPANQKPAGKKRPRGWHRGARQDEIWLDVDRRLRGAEGEAA